jgi:hypothetical protein
MPKMHTQKVYTWLWCSSEAERNDGQTNLAERNVVEIGRETTVGHGTGPSRLAKKKLGGTTRCHGAGGQSHLVEFRKETSVPSGLELRETLRRLGNSRVVTG